MMTKPSASVSPISLIVRSGVSGGVALGGIS
jgi:hypothetical protein